MSQHQSIQKLRKGILAIDKKIIELFAQRFKTTKEIQDLKREFGLPLTQKKREKELVKIYKKWAEQKLIPDGLIERIFQAVFSYSKKTGIIKRTKIWKMPRRSKNRTR